jgi:hypothetical protein
MPSDDEAKLVSASQKAELNCVLKNITNYVTNSGLSYPAYSVIT